MPIDAAVDGQVLDEMVGELLSLSLNGRDVVYTRSGLDLFANGVDSRANAR